MSELSGITTGLDSYDVEELVGYVKGELSEPPAVLDKLMTNLYDKMATVAGYTVAAEVQRQAKLNKFLSKLEEELFDEDMIQTMSREDLMDLHARVSQENTKSIEATRKWLKENKDTIKSKKTEVEKLAAQLSTLSPDKLNSIKKILEGESLMPDNKGFDTDL